MKKLWIGTLFLFLLISTGAETVKLGIFNLDPFLMEVGPDKKPGGVTIDYWEQYIAPRMGVDLEVSGPYPILRLFKMLENGTIDVIPQLTKNAERESLYLIPETPISKIQTCLVVLKDSRLNKITRKEDLYNLQIGFFEGGTIPDFLKDNRIKIVNVTNADYRKANLDKLTSDKIDGMFDLNYTSMLYDISRMGYKDKVKTLLLPIEPIYVYSIFTKSARGRELMNLFEKANKQVYGTSAFDDVTEKYVQ